MSVWEELERPGPDSAVVGGVELRAGSRVRLRPRPGRDVWDVALDGRSAVVDALECDTDDELHVVVTVEDDPGRDLGEARQMGHRFFFALDEVEPLGDAPPAPAPAGPRVLVAGIGNVFLGDDGFGVALAARLARRELPAGVEVVDYGIRGMDLAYAMGEGWDAVVLLDATPRGEAPGTLYVIEADLDEAPEGVPDAHAMDPVQVLALARSLDAPLPRTLVVGCEPATRMTIEDDELVHDLSEPVRAALGEAERLALSVLADLTSEKEEEAR
jgi:hydrogenase maturation protease